MRNHVTTMTTCTEDIIEGRRAKKQSAAATLVTYCDIPLRKCTQRRSRRRTFVEQNTFSSLSEPLFVRQTFLRGDNGGLAISRSHVSNARDNLMRDCRQLISRVRIVPTPLWPRQFREQKIPFVKQKRIEFIMRSGTKRPLRTLHRQS